MKNTFKIKVGETPALCSIEMNGAPLQGVTRVSFDLDGQRKPNVLRLEIIGEIQVEGEFHDRVIASTEPHDPEQSGPR
ncbi:MULTISPECIES: hypothetical protein [unclassified Mesorhizobium]|uniref:hypothetical protein n=1 Tax=unclassified Mesorhizobium TaxID=325217 RepID=UPI000FCA3916|nr:MULTISPECIES: hypothetical protein [unclassified Mesorhizobium]TGR73206.1 hypothetical protein EN832_33795 [Mesorhizobium sp. M1C.F.Ca.ET.189.01.1.1]TGS80970.1 hypothetical protein EN818_30715 [Mesorhizobium sp. M3A.F.Ca.ET.175.01.1.1]TGP22308.1 hypothetical protein EN874_019540 [Mesorhizobium sp. M1D.F.Ca.ET.231.01.1.1]TGP24722.1 hypothetical protein EN877_30655 [Mesorhizobium sp. M1D.F.Ca.ET.234.01.1.1]TGS37325.1 hypothetical protein EN827_30960 [Mesorhizobium sp. M1D.F.Ca.ET.184.01.1.1]